MPCIPNPKVNPPAAAPAPIAQGADALKLGADDETTTNRTKGAVGRLALRVANRSAE